MKGWSERLLELLFPTKCAFCGKVVEGERLCPECQVSLPWLEGRAAESQPEFVERAASALRYQGAVKDCVRRMKFERNLSLTKTLGWLTAQCAQDHFQVQFDLVTYPPLSKKSLRKRGFDQARLLAEEVGRRLEVPVAGVFDKDDRTGQQSLLKTPSSRRANVLGAYALKDGAEVAGKVILLVDDVITSGATMGECARVLLMADAAEIYAVSPVKGGTPGEKAGGR